jgi:hypothetical protein
MLHPGRRVPPDIHVNLGPGSPCRDDAFDMPHREQ